MKRSKNSWLRGWASFKAFTTPALHECWDLNSVFMFIKEVLFTFEPSFQPWTSMSLKELGTPALLSASVSWLPWTEHLPLTHIPTNNALSSFFFNTSPKASRFAHELKLLNPVPDFASLKDDCWRYLSTMKQSWMLWWKAHKLTWRTWEMVYCNGNSAM